jgi:uncharacterized Zn finger protein
MGRWGIDQVLGLAPDDSAKSAAKGLTSPNKWSETGSTETLVWGKCQGSGKQPYQVSVDLNGPAFRCTCPSRKFPCKHGLALLLLWATNDGAVGDAMQAAPFADEWAAERAKKDEARSEKADKKAEKLAAELADPELKTKREAARISKISAGLDDLDQWLQDLVRQGLATAKTAPYSFWDQQAARLVDAQAPGVAERIQELASIVTVRTDWSQVLLQELGLLHLIVQGWQNRESLSEPLAADLRTAIGWSRSLDEVRATSNEHDRWLVVGIRQDGEAKRIRSQRTWLWGMESKQWALLLDFATGGGGFGVSQIIGAEMNGPASFFPGSPPQRAIIDNVLASVSHDCIPLEIGFSSLNDAMQFISSCIGANPWIRRIPIVLHDVKLDVIDSIQWALTDSFGATFGVSFSTSGWRALAATGHDRCSIALEFEDGNFWVLSIATSEGWLPL